MLLVKQPDRNGDSMLVTYEDDRQHPKSVTNITNLTPTSVTNIDVTNHNFKLTPNYRNKPWFDNFDTTVIQSSPSISNIDVRYHTCSQG